MLATTIYEQGDHRWIMFGRDPDKAEGIIDTNQYLVISGEEAILLDPGGIELFAPMLSAVLKYVPADQIRYLFASHQDPDIISSLGLWDQALPNASLYSPWLWEGFIRHFGMERIRYCAIPDEGLNLTVGRIQLQFVPAHYLHSSGNFHVYDPKAKILMSGDVGAALEPGEPPLWVENMSQHSAHMKTFHQRWMPSNEAKDHWLRRVRQLDIDIMAPQHGRLFKQAHVDEFFNWFEQLSVGIALR
ncbi:MBL fold metallo-hydrolase [Bacterioplanes sanyensis]|uniref:MBL fold metallo-hydrolase n=1 Tax=Bacterioplanes sanyensis TaxID=1249553 RepID=UPI001671A50B|nr:MBL fold metallo-hydrolase [Bacterioplanes sanyensis]GGY34769.1 MBL fold metallo-hydrolase [Bacterioplanes sanyensis]